MGLFDKFKNIFTNKKEAVAYQEGLEKTSKEFVNKINLLSNKYKKVSDEYFEELEEIFISWWMYAKEDLMNYYGLALSQNNLEKIKQLDENRKFLKKEEGISR